MDIKILFTVFFTVFAVEPGDKTQHATLLFAADVGVSKWTMLAGAALALVATSALLAGSAISGFMSLRQLQPVAGASYIANGIRTFARA